MMLTQELDACRVQRVLGDRHQDAVLVIPDDCVQHVSHCWGGPIRQEDLLHQAQLCVVRHAC